MTTIVRDEVLNHGGHICNAECTACNIQTVTYTPRPTQLLTERRIVCMKCGALLARLEWASGEHKPTITINTEE